MDYHLSVRFCQLLARRPTNQQNFTTIFDAINSKLIHRHFIQLNKFVNKTLVCIWLVQMLIACLLIFHWTKPLIFALIVCINMIRIALRSLKMFFIICLLWPPTNRFSGLTTNSIKQIDGVPMGSPLGPALANISMCSFENKLLIDCPQSLKPIFQRWYVDDLFVLLSSLDQGEKFKKYLSSKYPCINFQKKKKKMMIVYLVQASTFFVKKKNLSPVFIGKDLQWCLY